MARDETLLGRFDRREPCLENGTSQTGLAGAKKGHSGTKEATLNENDVHLPPKQAATLIHKSLTWLKRMRRTPGRADAPPFYRIGGRVVYLKSEVVAWFDRQRA